MKLVINASYGGFSIKPEIINEYGFDQPNSLYYNKDDRTNEKLIELIESGIDCSDEYSDLAVVEIPDEATDYYINEYDGAESVLYVVNGKIYEK